MKSKLFNQFALLVFVVTGTTSLNSCNNNPTEIKIGAILPLTGEAAFIGNDIKNGVALKIDSFNKVSNFKIKIVFEDSKAEPKIAISAYEKLKAEGIKIIIGPAASSEVLALAKNANSDKIILFSPSASAPAISDAGDYIFRNELSDNLGATKQGELAIQQLGWKNIGVIYINNDYGVGVNQSFTKTVNELGGIIVFDKAYQPGLKDFKPLIADIDEKDLDGILIVAQAEYPNVIKQIRERGLKIMIMATPVFENKDFVNQLGREYSEGIVYAYYGGFDPSLEDKKIIAFNKKYKSLYSAQPSYYAALGYDNASIICDVLIKTKYNIDQVKDSLYRVKDFVGLTGTISIDKNGDVNKPIYLKVVNDLGFFLYKHLP